MRQVSAEFLREVDIVELKAGRPLLMLSKGRPVAEIIPATEINASLAANVEELMMLLQKGFDLGGARMGNRDELYERDSSLRQ